MVLTTIENASNLESKRVYQNLQLSENIRSFIQNHKGF
jgi:hypothetical protein